MVPIYAMPVKPTTNAGVDLSCMSGGMSKPDFSLAVSALFARKQSDQFAFFYPHI